jgi:hypothetical protein
MTRVLAYSLRTLIIVSLVPFLLGCRKEMPVNVFMQIEQEHAMCMVSAMATGAPPGKKLTRKEYRKMYRQCLDTVCENHGWKTADYVKIGKKVYGPLFDVMKKAEEDAMFLDG